jgi:heat shock protein HtpX
MALSHNIKPDRGLTTRMLFTGFFLVVLYAVLIGVLFIFIKSLILVLVIGFGLLFCQYFFSDKIAMYAMHAKEVTPEQAPELHGVIDRLCALADMPKPRVAIAQTDIPNAFATGRSPKAAVVCATTGLLRRLDEPEVEAVLSHEISHVAHRDVAIMTIASGLGLIAGLLTRVLFYSELFGGGGRNNNNNSGSQLAIIELIVLLVSVVVYFVSFLLTMALSRYRELAADRSGAILIGQPSRLASALIKISGSSSCRPWPGRRPRTVAATRAGAVSASAPSSAPTPASNAAWLSSTSSSTSSAKPAERSFLTWASSTPCWVAPNRSRPTSMRSSPSPRPP